MSRRPDQVTVDLNVCEAPEPLEELRRIYDTVSETLGFRPLQQFIGSDVVQLKIMLHALGFYRAGSPALDPSGAGINRYEQEAVEAVDRFRAAQGWQTTVPGYVDARTIDRLWLRLEEAGQAEAVRERFLELTQIRR
jgi:uncharacterized Ntn-hydrolase superfamily protein